MKHRVLQSLKGLRNSNTWHRKLDGYMELDGKPLTDFFVRKLVEYGLEKGYDTNDDFTDEDINSLVSQYPDNVYYKSK